MRTRTDGSNIITSTSVEICKRYCKKLLKKFSIDCYQNNLMYFQSGVACVSLLSDFVSVCMWFLIVTWEILF